MKVMLELLGDAANVLDNLEDVEGLRPSTRRRVGELLERLSEQSDRLLAELDEAGAGKSGGERRKAVQDERASMMQRGLAALARNRLDDARQVFEEAVGAYPDDVELLNHLALTCWEQSAFDEAAGWYGQAMEAGLAKLESGEGNRCKEPSRDYCRAIEGRGLCLYRLGEYDEAVELFETLASLAPAEFGSCRYLAGEIRHLQGNPEAARDAYRETPAEPSVFYNLALAHWQLDEREEAAVAFIRGFLTNRYIAAELLETDVPAEEAGSTGYLESAGYAEEYLGACGSLWEESEGVKGFLRECWEHPRVAEYLQSRWRAVDAGPTVDDTRAERLKAGDELRDLARRVLRKV